MIHIFNIFIVSTILCLISLYNITGWWKTLNTALLPRFFNIMNTLKTLNTTLLPRFFNIMNTLNI